MTFVAFCLGLSLFLRRRRLLAEARAERYIRTMDAVLGAAAP
jgi:hypothetical protein